MLGPFHVAVITLVAVKDQGKVPIPIDLLADPERRAQPAARQPFAQVGTVLLGQVGTPVVAVDFQLYRRTGRPAKAGVGQAVGPRIMQCGMALRNAVARAPQRQQIIARSYEELRSHAFHAHHVAQMVHQVHPARLVVDRTVEQFKQAAVDLAHGCGAFPRPDVPARGKPSRSAPWLQTGAGRSAT